MVDICLLGTGGGMPMPYRDLSSLLINFKGRKILVDCGEGTQVAMRKIGWGFKSLDIILITHCHGDHIIGLPGLLSTIGNSGREKPIIIIGPVGIKDVINGLRVACPYLPYELIVLENPSTINLKLGKENIDLVDSLNYDISINTLELEHSAQCLGYSFYFKRLRKFNVEKAIANNVPKELWSKLQKEEKVVIDNKIYDSNLVLGDERRGIKLSFITDSRPLNSIPDFISESDLFICEGTYGDDGDIDKAIKNKHMTFSEAATLAKKGTVKELLLTHFSPAMLNPDEFLENANNIFENTLLGVDRIIKTLNYS
ncbi:ribonuclease Z [Clostridium massiliamazoniense]|uniref:ribonuclease Z n=1 Tax=Clostridium massiliamazoniense TaxID=1347366 RepID=UPI0006D79F73|nr:ribonuclease Z [Clostridium massiliamazoniense]